MVCIDSDILINFLRNRDAEKYRIKELIEEEVELCTTTINTFELFKGLKNIKEDSSLLISNISNFIIFDFDIDASKKAAEIIKYLESKGELIDLADIMIASIAISNNEPFLTNNISHFKRIPELKLESI